MNATIRLRGSTWDHPRGLDPLIAAATSYRAVDPSVAIEWDVRSLLDFDSQSVSELAKQYDLMVIDHPHLGDAASDASLVPLGHTLRELAESETVGPSARSYVVAGECLALPVDAASHVSAYRPDLLKSPPASWAEVETLANEPGMLWALRPLDALCSFMSLAASRGTPAIDDNTFMTAADAASTLELMRGLAARVPSWCLEASPVQVLDRLASDQDDDRYTPITFGYTNYSRAGFAPRLVAVAPFPGIEGPIGALLGGAGIAVSSHSTHRDAALRFAGWLASPSVQSGVYVEAGGQPAASTAWNNPHANAITGDFFVRARETIEHSWLRPRIRGFPEWQDIASELIHDALTGAASTQDVTASLRKAFTNSCGTDHA